MSAVAKLIEDMIAAGVSADLIGRTAALLAEREAVLVPDEQAERRRAKDRERKRLRNSADSAEFQNGAPPIKETSPTPPKENYPLSSEPTVLRCGSARRHEWPADFADKLWAIYPRKTEKKAGMDALARLHHADRVAWTDVVAGVEAMFEADPQFVPALARWIRGERWKDERPAARPPPHRQAKPNSLLDGLEEIENLRFGNNVQPFARIAN